MSMSKLVKSGAVVVAETAYEIPVTRHEIYDEVLYEEMEYEDIADEDEDLEEDLAEYEEPAAQEPEVIEQEPEAEPEPEPEPEPEEKREEIDKEALKNFAQEIISETSTQTLSKTSEIMGEEIIVQAQRTAELIVNHTLESAKFELNNVIAQAYADGFAEGKSEALSAVEPALAKIAAFARSVMSIQDAMLENFRDGMFGMISEISAKILHKEISMGDEYLLELYREALKSIKAEEFVTVTVGESQVDFVMRNADLFREAVSHIQDFRILAEKDAARGTMVVETAKSIADASCHVQEEKIGAILSQLRDTLVIPQSAEEIEELEKIKRMREENLDYLQGLSGGGEEFDSESFGKMENIDYENFENLSDIDTVER